MSPLFAVAFVAIAVILVQLVIFHGPLQDLRAVLNTSALLAAQVSRLYAEAEDARRVGQELLAGVQGLSDDAERLHVDTRTACSPAGVTKGPPPPCNCPDTGGTPD